MKEILKLYIDDEGYPCYEAHIKGTVDIITALVEDEARNGKKDLMNLLFTALVNVFARDVTGKLESTFVGNIKTEVYKQRLQYIKDSGMLPVPPIKGDC